MIKMENEFQIQTRLHIAALFIPTFKFIFTEICAEVWPNINFNYLDIWILLAQNGPND